MPWDLDLAFVPSIFLPSSLPLTSPKLSDFVRSAPYSLAFEAHPFTISSIPLAQTSSNPLAPTVSPMVFLVKVLDGFTARLALKAAESNGKCEIKAYVDGPYGVVHSQEAYDNVVLVAGESMPFFSASQLEPDQTRTNPVPNISSASQAAPALPTRFPSSPASSNPRKRASLPSDRLPSLSLCKTTSTPPGSRLSSLLFFKAVLLIFTSISVRHSPLPFILPFHLSSPKLIPSIIFLSALSQAFTSPDLSSTFSRQAATATATQPTPPHVSPSKPAHLKTIQTPLTRSTRRTRWEGRTSGSAPSRRADQSSMSSSERSSSLRLEARRAFRVSFPFSSSPLTPSLRDLRSGANSPTSFTSSSDK
jgi:hypothetical protein